MSSANTIPGQNGEIWQRTHQNSGSAPTECRIPRGRIGQTLSHYEQRATGEESMAISILLLCLMTKRIAFLRSPDDLLSITDKRPQNACNLTQNGGDFGSVLTTIWSFFYDHMVVFLRPYGRVFVTILIYPWQHHAFRPVSLDARWQNGSTSQHRTYDSPLLPNIT